MQWYKIVETDNHGGDYPDEKEIPLPYLKRDQAERIANAINAELCTSDDATRYWKVVVLEYKLVGGFEP